jgi:PAS domain S-box-containing protein
VSLSDGRQILIVAPFGRDAQSLAQLLTRDGHECRIHTEMAPMAADLGERTGAVLLTEEALAGDRGALAKALVAQPDWSHIPFILLVSRRSGATPASEAVRHALPEEATHAIVLERPLGSVSLLSTVSWALRLRRKQFDARDRLAELAAREAELRESREALIASEADLRLVADSLPVLIAFVDRDRVYRFANHAYEDWVGMPAAEVIGRSMEEVVGAERIAERQARLDAAYAGAAQEFEVPWPRGDGTFRVADTRYLPRFAPDGSVLGIHVFVQDVTARRDAEAVLRDAAATLERRVAERTAELDAQMVERERIEAALRQAQKMEAVGQLTGGIAHDFNNMLTGIIGAIDIMKRRIATGRTDDLNRFMDAASVSAKRAAALTHRLLAFSRRQSLDARPVDVNLLVDSLSDLLTRTLSERVALTIRPAPATPTVLVDANQLESVILNLAINARDAMPDGGTLTVETRTMAVDAAYAAARPGLAPGDYVTIGVSDTGTGMTADVVEKVFEPFFTTKPIGQGTGLGLSMVYGFVQQSGGHVQIRSAPGMGTRVTLYLPATAAPVALPTDAAENVPVGAGQTVLLVEDDESVRLLILDLLSELGYVAVEAGDAAAAIPILASDRPIDLLVSDVGLPGMDGRQLAEVARGHRPDLPVLFVTGYAEQAAVRSGFLGENMEMMTKPFAIDALAAKIRDMLRGRSVRTDRGPKRR